MDLLEQLGPAIERTQRIVDGVRPDQLADATACGTFDVRALINHLCGANRNFTRAAAGEKVEGVRGGPPPEVIGDDHPRVYRESGRALLEAFSEPGVLDRTFRLPFADIPGSFALAIILDENVVHGWDLAQATGQALPIDADVADALLVALAPVVSPQFRGDPPAPFKPPIDVGDDAPAHVRLLAFLGREA
jgi:uncharacterized protein (TIGR03086 family)